MMELLNTIWRTFTTESVLITDIINIFSAFIEVTLTIFLFTQIVNINSIKQQRILFIVIFSFVAIFSYFFIPIPYYTFINILTFPIIIVIIFKTNLLKTILATILPYILFVLIGSITQIIYTSFLRITNESILIIPIHKLIFSCIMYSTVYVVYRVIKYFNIKITLFDNMHQHSLYTLIINFIVGVSAIAVQSYLAVLYGDRLPISINITNILVSLIYFIISIYSLLRTSSLEKTRKTLAEEQLYNKTLTILHDNIRGFKHDFHNIVQSIGGFIKTNDMYALKNYYNDLLEDCQRVNNLSVLNPEIINNPAIYSLLTSKYHTADEFGIKINLDVFLDLSQINMKTYELTRILGILLDNSIEATNLCDDKVVNIVIRKDLKVHRQLFIIENTYTNKDINTDKIFEKGFSTKETNRENHGLGLWEVRQILKKNNNLNLHTSKDDKYFKQQLEIYY